MKKTMKIQQVLFTLPAILLTAGFLAYPIIYSFIISLTNYNGISRLDFIGLSNYAGMLVSREFLRVALNNMYFAVLGVPIATIIPMIIALFLYEGIIGQKFFKVTFLLPSVLSVVIVGILFRTMFSYNGPINYLLKSVGLGKYTVDWLSSGSTSIPIIILAMVWANFGINTIIYLSGMSSIPPSIYESADLDGFSRYQKLIYITLPMIWSVFEFITVMNIITVFSSMFGYVFTITSGGPGYESTVLEYLLYIKGFRLNDLGYASAISVVLFIVMFLFTRLTMKFFSLKGENV